MRVLSVQTEGGSGLPALELPGHRDDWYVDHALSLRQAIERLKSAKYELMVIDFRQPVRQGVEFLTKVRTHMPSVARIAVVSLGDSNSAEEVSSVCHDVVALPGLASTIRDAGERAVAVLASDNPGALTHIMQRLDRLPSRPGLYSELRQAAQNGSSLFEIGRMLEQDVSITAQLINMANSAFFAFNSPARSASEAVTRLGLNCTTGVVLATEGASNLGPEHRRLVEKTNQHSIELANLARTVAGEDDRLFLAAVLHDIGQVAMLVLFPDSAYDLYRQVSDESEQTWRERAFAGVDHASLGGYLLRLWKIDPMVARIIELHHEPWKARDDDPPEVVDYATLLACLHLLDEDAVIPEAGDDEFVQLVHDLREALAPMLNH
ncbi:MAG: HDOD domain-containing protein [Acidimicrobiales bacterium]